MVFTGDREEKVPEPEAMFNVPLPPGVGAGNTVRLNKLLVIPDRLALILVVPEATPVDRPDDDIVAALGLELDQLTREEMFAVEPSEYVPVAVNSKVQPTAKLAGGFGVTEIEDKAGMFDAGMIVME